MDPEVDREGDGSDAPLEDHHGLLLGAPVPLLVVGKLLPVAVAVRVPEANSPIILLPHRSMYAFIP